MKKIVICGGHLTPALALIEELKEQKPSPQIYFFGRKYATEGSKNISAEYQQIKKLGINFYEITSGRLQRRWTRYTIPSLLKIPVGFTQSLIYLLKIRPHLIVSFGGYLSLPVVLAGWLLGIDSISHEQASIGGLASRINSQVARKIFLAWPQSEKYFDRSKCQVIGNLDRKSLFKKTCRDKKIKSFLEKAENLILVAGGNQGSHFLNQLIFNSLLLHTPYFLLHQLGTANLGDDRLKAKSIRWPKYLGVPYIDPEDFGAVLAKAKLVISRSGANTVWELAMLAKPAILVPLPISGEGEQMANARILEKAGMATIINQEILTPKLLSEKIDKMMKDLPFYQKAADVFAKSLPQNAAQKFSQYIEYSLNPSP